nr:MAG TPA: hypothetical protein [Caudoviricetes sp.]
MTYSYCLYNFKKSRSQDTLYLFIYKVKSTQIFDVFI